LIASPGSPERKGTGPIKFVHRFIFFGLYFILFAVISLPSWYVMRDVLPRSVSLANDSSWFSPVIVSGTRIHYVGFLFPLVVSIIALIAYTLMETSKPPLPRSLKALIVVVPIAFVLSQFTVLGIFVSVGLSDPLSLVALTIAAYNLVIGRPASQSALLSYPLGFAVGLLSDLESLSYFHGVFGGYGLGDGDFLFPLGFLITTVIFSKTWKPLYEALLSLESRVDDWVRRRRLTK
jgi:hypothetical protein